MPVVPRVTENSVRDQGMSGARVSTSAPIEAFGGGDALETTARTARALNTEVSSAALDIAIKQKRDADEVRVQDADLEASKAQTDIQLETKKMQGKDAFGAPDYADNEWKKRTDEIRAKLSNDAQKAAFDKIYKVRTNDLYRSTQEHVSVESKRYDDQSTDAYVENARNAAAANYTDVAAGGEVDKSIFLQEQAIRKYGRRYGISEEAVDNKVAEAKTKTHAAVIDQMLANNMDQQAEEYFKNNKDGILPDARIKLEKSIYEGVLLGEGQRKADEMFSKYSNNRNKAFDEIKKIKDPELRKQTEDQIEKMFVRQGLAERAQNQNNYKLASQLVEQNQEVPGNIRASLTVEQNSALQRRLKQINADVKPETDWATYYDLKNKAADKKNDFVKENLLEYRHVLADGEFKELVNLQGQLSKNDQTAEKQLSGYRTSTMVVNDTLISAGINVKSKNVREQKKVSQFRRLVDENVQALQYETGKKVTADDVQKITDNLLINAIDQKGLFGLGNRRVRAFELEVRDVPKAFINDLVPVFKAKGVPLNDRTILDYYRKYLSKRESE